MAIGFGGRVPILGDLMAWQMNLAEILADGAWQEQGTYHDTGTRVTPPQHQNQQASDRTPAPQSQAKLSTVDQQS